MNSELHPVTIDKSTEWGRTTTGKGIGRQEDNFMVLWFVASHRFLSEFDELSPTNISMSFSRPHPPVLSYRWVLVSSPQLLFTKYPACGISHFLSLPEYFTSPITRRGLRTMIHQKHWLINGYGNGIQLNQKLWRDKAFCSTNRNSSGKEATTEFGQA